MSTIRDVFAAFQQTPGLDECDIGSMLAFIELATSLKPYITHAQLPRWDATQAPEMLPSSACGYLSNRLGITPDFVDGLWDGLKQFIWSRQVDPVKMVDGPRREVFEQVERKYQLCMFSS